MQQIQRGQKVQGCSAPPFGEAARCQISPKKAEKSVARRLTDPLVMLADSIRKVRSRPVLATEEDSAGNGVVPQAEGSHIEDGDIDREP